MRVISDFPPYSVRGSAKRYDWTVILDGHIRELERGIDFDCQPSSLVATVKDTARKRSVPVEVRSYIRREDQRAVVAVKALEPRV